MADDDRSTLPKVTLERPALPNVTPSRPVFGSSKAMRDHVQSQAGGDNQRSSIPADYSSDDK